MTPARALLMLVAIAVAIAIYLSLAKALGLTEFWAGFLWLLYWAGIEQAQREKLLPSLLGSAIGLSSAYLMQLLPHAMGSAGLVIAVLSVAVIVFCQLMKWATVLANNASMLFLTVASIPHMLAGGNFPQMYAALAVGAAFFGGLLLTVEMVRTRAGRCQA